MYDMSIVAILAAHDEVGIKTWLRRSSDDRWSPGDVFARASILPLVGMEPNSFGCAVKGSKLAGGAVSLFIGDTKNTRAIRVLDDALWMEFYGGERQANQTLLEASCESQKLSRCVTPFGELDGHKSCVAYLADARVVSSVGGGRWQLRCGVLGSNEELVARWVAEREA